MQQQCLRVNYCKAKKSDHIYPILESALATNNTSQSIQNFTCLLQLHLQSSSSPLLKPHSRRTCLIIISKLFFHSHAYPLVQHTSVCVVNVIVKHSMLLPCVVKGTPEILFIIIIISVQCHCSWKYILILIFKQTCCIVWNWKHIFFLYISSLSWYIEYVCVTNKSKPHVLYYQFILLFLKIQKKERGWGDSKCLHEKGEEQG